MGLADSVLAKIEEQTQRAREGKLNPGAGSVRDLILGSES